MRRHIHAGGRVRLSVTAILAAGVLAVIGGSALGVTFTVDTAIGAGDATYDNQDIVVDHCTLTIDGVHPFNSLQVINGGVVTHSSATSGQAERRVDLTVVQDVTIDATSRIDATGRGFAHQSGPGAGAGGYLYGSGASHGGNGGIGATSTSGSAGGPAYDDFQGPNLPGSGGADSSTAGIGGAGGGVIRLVVSGTLTIEGQVVANGNDGSSPYGGGGSGGTISLSAVTRTGTGTIAADGGSGASAGSGGGGGGRIVFSHPTDTFTGTTSAKGGSGYVYGGAGTIYTLPSGPRTPPMGDVVVDNGGNAGASTPFSSSSIPANLTVRNGGCVSGQSNSLMINGTLRVGAGGLMMPTAPQMAFGIIVYGSSIDVDAGGAISADGKGYGSDNGTGRGAYGVYGAGGGYGGNGGNAANTSGGVGVLGGNAYGYLRYANDAGSGGGHSTLSGSGGAGGGALTLTVMNGTLTVNGRVSANGDDGGLPYGGGGSGGGIRIDVGTLAGSGVITANGGAGADVVSGGGGGGRIVLSWKNANTFTGTKSAYGGAGYVRGGAGTIYEPPALGQTWGTVWLDNGGASGAGTPIWDLAPSTEVTIANGAWGCPQPGASFMSIPGNLHIASGGGLRPNVSSSPGSPLKLDVTLFNDGNMTVDAGGTISADGGGHVDTGPGYGGSGTYGAGGGHGGKGGDSVTALGGEAYNYSASMSDFGSSGGRGSTGADGTSGGGAGGGFIRIDVQKGSLTVNGQLSANGLDGGMPYGGGGSGGGIAINAGAFSGAGSITADGGDGADPGSGGGAGGRLTFECGSDGFTGTRSAHGGAGYVRGGAGAIFTRTWGVGDFAMLMENGGTRGALTPLTPPGSTPPTCASVMVSGGAACEIASGVPAVELLTIGDGGAVYLQTHAEFGNVHVLAGGELGHLATKTGFDLAVAGDLVVDAGGAISANGKGYGSASGTGRGANAPYAGGGGYGGAGGASVLGAPGGVTYGLPANPVELGSGGGADSTLSGGAGGGAIRLRVIGTLQLDGRLGADGGDGIVGAIGGGGGGSGGSIHLTAGTLTGSGAISANGGAGSDFYDTGGAGGGGGGRIALYCDQISQFNAARIEVDGGDGYKVGGRGTIYGLPFDGDYDGDVDLDDFSRFRACFNGPNQPPAQADCADADRDHDSDVDLADFSLFRACFNGPNRPAAETCFP